MQANYPGKSLSLSSCCCRVAGTGLKQHRAKCGRRLFIIAAVDISCIATDGDHKTRSTSCKNGQYGQIRESAACHMESFVNCWPYIAERLSKRSSNFAATLFRLFEGSLQMLIQERSNPLISLCYRFVVKFEIDVEDMIPITP